MSAVSNKSLCVPGMQRLLALRYVSPNHFTDCWFNVVELLITVLPALSIASMVQLGLRIQWLCYVEASPNELSGLCSCYLSLCFRPEFLRLQDQTQTELRISMFQVNCLLDGFTTHH